VLAAARATGVGLAEHRIVIFGAGTAGTGIADQLTAAMLAEGLPEDEARARFWAIDRPGLLTTATPGIGAEQSRYARPAAEVAAWHQDDSIGGVGLAEVVRQVHPTILIGTSTRAGAFTEPVVRDMAAHCARPVILPMSNPTSLSEAVPGDLIRWTEGRALVATGSPFPPVDYRGVRYVIGQANNALIFPGVGLGVIAARAAQVTDNMLAAAAHAVSELVDTSTPGAPLLPEVAAMRETSVAVAAAVARAAASDGVAGASLDGDLHSRIRALMWEPVYRPVRPA
jgi:malate dehydrogenase (oxaloacetate-decarboxylating)